MGNGLDTFCVSYFFFRFVENTDAGKSNYRIY